MAKTTIITATYNKAAYLAQARNSVLYQTDTDWEWWVILDGPDEATLNFASSIDNKKIKFFHEKTTYQDRIKVYRPAQIVNDYYPRISSKYIIWLSDDDLLEPNSLDVLTTPLENNSTWDIVYGHLECFKTYNSEHSEHNFWIKAEHEMGPGTGRMPDCVIDGGQILHTSRSYNFVKPVLDTSFETANHADGLLMNALANYFIFHPVDFKVVSHRATPISTWRRTFDLGLKI